MSCPKSPPPAHIGPPPPAHIGHGRKLAQARLAEPIGLHVRRTARELPEPLSAMGRQPGVS
jgi:hypothetical protein